MIRCQRSHHGASPGTSMRSCSATSRCTQIDGEKHQRHDRQHRQRSAQIKAPTGQDPQQHRHQRQIDRIAGPDRHDRDGKRGADKDRVAIRSGHKKPKSDRRDPRHHQPDQKGQTVHQPDAEGAA
jgi:hypothetical protein